MGRRLVHTSKRNIVVMLQSVDGLDLSTNVKLLCSLVQVLHGWVLWIAAKDLLRLKVLIWLVNIVDSQDGQVAIITEIPKSQSGSWCNAVIGDSLLRDIESDGHGEDVSVEKAVVGNNTTSCISCGNIVYGVYYLPIVISLVHETWCF